MLSQGLRYPVFVRHYSSYSYHNFRLYLLGCSSNSIYHCCFTQTQQNQDCLCLLSTVFRLRNWWLINKLGLFNYLPLSVNLHKGIYLNGFVAPIIRKPISAILHTLQCGRAGASSKTGTYLSSFNQEWSYTWDSVALPLYAILTYQMLPI